MARTPEIDWKAVKGLRDVLVMSASALSAKIVHATVRENLDPLEAAVITLLGEDSQPTAQR